MIRFLLILSFTLSALAQTTPVLIPVLYNGPGQYGSEWFTAVNINNRTAQVVQTFGMRFIDRACPSLEGCERSAIGPGSWGGIAGPNLQTGFFLHVPAAGSERFELDARFGERTRNTYGVELPLARENDFRRTAIALPYVALRGFADTLRTTLRMYGLEMAQGQRVRIDLAPFGSETIVATKTVTLELSDAPGAALPLRPAFAQVELQREFPGIFGSAITVRVTPLPMPDGQAPRIWAFATAVRNDNNEVAVYSPR